jgi:hypothetical protein
MVQNSFQRAKGNPGNRPHNMEAKKQRIYLLKIVCPIKSDIDKDTPMKTPEPPEMFRKAPQFLENSLLHERNVLEKWGTH